MRTLTVLKNAPFAKSGEEFTNVALPHTWNALDGQDGGSDYWRGTAVYKIALPEPTPGKRQYIQFEGANHIATVFCNGKELGTHKGGFSTFRYELTDTLLPAGNELTVEVSNPDCDVYPQMADFTFYGGLYRNVTFMEVEGVVLDEITVPYGYRSFHVDVNTGFYLNGQSMPLRGVARHKESNSP